MPMLWLGRVLHGILSPVLVPYLHRTKRVRVLVVNRDEQVLLVKGLLSHQNWTLPGGGIRRGERALEAALREVGEETGVILQANQLQDLGQTTHLKEYPRAQFRLYGVRIDHQAAIIPRRAKFEIIAAQWLPINDIPPDSVPGLQALVATQRQHIEPKQ